MFIHYVSRKSNKNCFNYIWSIKNVVKSFDTSSQLHDHLVSLRNLLMCRHHVITYIISISTIINHRNVPKKSLKSKQTSIASARQFKMIDKIGSLSWGLFWTNFIKGFLLDCIIIFLLYHKIADKQMADKLDTDNNYHLLT